jgi:hypothetical protein
MVTVSYLDNGRAAYTIDAPRAAVRAAVAAALADFQADLLAINPRLAEQEDVVALERQRAALSDA